MNSDVQPWATTEELAAHYIARAHQLAHEMRFANLRVARGSLQSERSWRAAVDERKESQRAEIETLRALARDLVPSAERYAEVAQEAIRRAEDVTCSQCYGRVFVPGDADGSAPRCAFGGSVRGLDGERYWRCSASHTVARGAVPPLH
ncbi:hypothetical protein [Streptomyces violaceusniger]|uniref:Uncharacterized protein n=1 Tax=Streptomyces violaceusniger (strain Tu 4113) TaxID=653045 RepID=G2PHR5_STRV4|nr:hypothetical protein [Streptomyces violaceusniger]AEM88866.1 hypothetical protein Strvi_0090 [Streptomyces violaceusniger Tu 4113]